MIKRTEAGFAAAAVAAALMLSAPAHAAGVKIGVLSCAVDSGWGVVVGSSRDVDCTYRGSNGYAEHYSGKLEKVGVDLGYVKSGELVWGVVAPTSSVEPGALAGQYAGATAGATIGVGGDVNVLIGGLDKSIALQPISVQGDSGIDVSAGIGALHLSKVT